MLRNAAEYSPPRRGGVDAPSIKWIRSEIGAAGVVSSAKLFRPEDFAELTTITASRCRARASRPSAPLAVASQLLLDAAAPPRRGGEYSTFNISPIRSHTTDRRTQSGANEPAALDGILYSCKICRVSVRQPRLLRGFHRTPFPSLY